MEAVVALGVAGNTIQFLDFATRLCVTSIEIHRSADGASGANSHAETLLKTFVESIDEVSSDLGHYFHALDVASIQASQQKDVQIKLIIKDCRDIAENLSGRFKKLKSSGDPGKWKSFLIGMKCVWRKNELEDLHTRLKKNRDELEWRILLSLREGMNLLASRQEDQFRDLQSAVVTELTEVIRSHVSSLPQWPNSLEQTLERLRTDVIATAASKYIQPEKSAIRRRVDSINSHPESTNSASFADEYAADCAARLAEAEKERWESLHFQVMDDREEQIADAELKTFEWILRPPQHDQRPRSNFIQWLANGRNIYWISGKAGSGKSTLVKYLKGHHSVGQTSQAWAAGVPLITASFFFWYQGNTLQKTQEGLLRSLLYQSLDNHRELIPTVLEDTFDLPSRNLATYWTLPRLKIAFKKLMEQNKIPLKILFLVDGLDEYSGDHAEIVEVFQYASRFDHVKVCVSSRPLIVFDRAFKTCPGLMLQNLTFNDIQTYVKTKFHNDERFQELELEEPGLGPEIALQVVTKASGVFLWVRLVVHSLLEGIENYDRGVDLHRRLDELPEDLADLYWHMLDRVKPVWYLEEGFRLLLLAHSAIAPLTLLRLTLCELARSSGARDPSNLSLKRQQALCRSMAGRVKSRCLGLLEVVGMSETDASQGKVQFLHKSVKDFINTPRMMSRIQECLEVSGGLFPEVDILGGISLELQTARSRLPKGAFGDEGELKREAWFDLAPFIRREAIRYNEAAARKSRVDYAKKQSIFMTEIDRTITELWESVSFRSIDEQKGITHWSDAPRKPGGSSAPEIF